MIKARLINITQRDADILVEKWLKEVLDSPYTPTYKEFPQKKLLERAKRVYMQMERWLDPDNKSRGVKEHYQELGRQRYAERFGLEEVVAAILLTKKVLWEYMQVKGLPTSAFELYSGLDLNNQVVYYYDMAIYHFICGYIEAETGNRCTA